jgi:hypothetical protein
MSLLKLIAFDKDDLEIFSAHLQDAIINSGEIIWRPSERRVVIPLCRFDWQSATEDSPQFRRRLAALRFERVTAFKSRNIESSESADVLNLLAIEFTDVEAPAGHVNLMFSGGAAIRLEVECLEGELADLGPEWVTARRPGHPDNFEG